MGAWNISIGSRPRRANSKINIDFIGSGLRIAIAQAKSRLLDARCEVCGTPIRPVSRQVVCGPKLGERGSACQVTKNLAQVRGITVQEAAWRRARFRSRTEARRNRRRDRAA